MDAAAGRGANEGQHRDVATPREPVDPAASPDAAPPCRARIRIVTADGTPAPGAELLYWPPRTAAARDADDARVDTTGDLEAALRATGRRSIADGQGLVAIVADAHSAVCARSGDDYGELHLGYLDEIVLQEARLELQRDASLRIEVVDSDGRPAPERMIELHAHCLSPRQGWMRTDDDLGRTDATGTLSVPHVLQRLGLPADAIEGTVRLSCARRTSDASVVTEAEQRLSWNELFASVTVRLVVPAGGTIVVTTTDASGAPCDPSVWLRDDRGETFDLEPTGATGESVFRNVPIGRRWEVAVRSTGCERDIDTPVAGPATAGDVVRLAVTVPVRPWQIHARVLRSDGEPVEGAKVTCACRGMADDPFSMTTREDGSIPFHTLWLNADVQRIDRMDLRIVTEQGQTGTFVVDHTLLPGPSDLGDFVLDPAPGETRLASIEVRCAGAVLDAQAWVGLYVSGEKHLEPVPCFVRRVGDVLELRGVPPSRPMQLVCGHPLCVTSQPQPVLVGEHRLVDLPRGASVVIAVSPPDIPADAIRATLTRAGDVDAESIPLDREQHTFAWSRLAPGRYSLRIETDLGLLHEEPALMLREGNQRWPADGARLDLRSRLAARCMVARSVVDDTEVPIMTLQVPQDATTLPPPDERYREWFVPRPGTDLLVRAWGYVPVRVTAPNTHVLLRLQPATRLKLDPGDAPYETIRARIVDDAVRDPLLRAFDTCNPHAPELDAAGGSDFTFAPGTVLEFTVVRGGKAGSAQSVVVGTVSPQRVPLP